MRSDTWEWAGTQWMHRTASSTPGADLLQVLGPVHHSGRNVAVSVAVGRSGLEVWEYSPIGWSAVDTSGPAPAGFIAAAAYDVRRNRLVLIDGVADEVIEWDGNTWFRVRHAPGSPARTGSLAYDPVGQRILHFGGSQAGGLSQDTWGWDGVRWTQLQPNNSPPARYGASLATDPRRNRIVLLGGSDGSNPLTDTWEWNGVDWLRIATSATPYAGVIAGDPAGNRVVNLSIDPYAAVAWRLWSYDGTDWTQIPVGRTPYFPRGFAFDSPGGTAVTFLEDSYFPSTWELVTVRSVASSPWFGQSCTGPGNIFGVLPNISQPPYIGASIELRVVSSGGFGFLLFGYSNTVSAAGPLPIALDPLGMTGCSLLVSPDDFVLLGPVDPFGALSPAVRIDICNCPNLVGARSYVQGGLFQAGVNPAGILVGEAVELTLGVR